jgi:erythritol transport system ATP-binding protein
MEARCTSLHAGGLRVNPSILAADSPIAFEARHITRRYPGNIALDDVTFRAYRGCVNVLIGENGAGKSTLMRILSGVERPDEGEVLRNGRPVRLSSPRDAAAQGISIVHQELSVLTNLSISDNIFAGRELTSLGLLSRSAEDKQAFSALELLKSPLPVDTPAAQLSLGLRQLLEIASALAQGCDILILDEPTSALSSVETEVLFAALSKLVADGVTIIYISHRLDELLHLGDHFTVLRSGRVVGEGVRGEVSREWIVETMSGRAAHAKLADDRVAQQEVVLEAQHISLAASMSDECLQTSLSDVCFQLHRGEILGIYGLLGSGRTELLETLAGCHPAMSGDTLFRGQKIHLRSIADGTAAGIALVPADRQRDGLIPELSVRENIAVAMAGERWHSRKQEQKRVLELVHALRIAVRDIELPVTALSGGNQQKVLLARCLLRSPAVLLLDEPTRGVDANAKREIYDLLRELASSGLAILFTSSEIEETQELADRALVLCQGRITADLPHAQITDVALFTAASPRVLSATSIARPSLS